MILGITHKPPIFQWRCAILRLRRAGKALLRCAALNYRKLRSLGFQIKVVGIASGLGVQVCVVPRDSGALDGRIFRAEREFLERIEDLLVDEVSLFDPAFYATGSPDLGKA